MNNKNLSKKKQKQLDRLNKSITYKKSEYPETGLPEKTDYFRVNRRYNIVCNNSVGGGDCHGDTFCLCKIWFYRPDEFMKYYRIDPKKFTPSHTDYICPDCSNKSAPNDISFTVCGCCYNKCPNCDYDPNY